MAIPFRLLRDALFNLSLDPAEQRVALCGSAITDELALDLDNAMGSLAFESQRTGISLDADTVSALRDLNQLLDPPPANPVWDESSLDTHPLWARARIAARDLLARLPDDDTKGIGGHGP